MSVTDEVKARIDIVSYIGRHVPGLKKAGRNYKAPCPFHKEKTPSFVVNPERQTWHCFGACSEGGDIFTFAQKIHNWDFREALRELAAEAGVELRQQTPQQKAKRDELERLRGLLDSAAQIYHRQLLHPASANVLRYVMDGRGFTRETVAGFQIGCAPPGWDFIKNTLTGLGYRIDELIEAGLLVRNENGRVYDRFRNRLMIPIRDDRGKVVGFGGRALDPAEDAKYINTPQSPLFEKNRLLFALDRARDSIRQSETAVIVEGYMDAIQAHQAGYANVVAQMGTALTEAQIRRIAPRYARRLVLALDSDEAGLSATRRSLEVARETLSLDATGKLAVDLRVLQVPAGKDPDDYLRSSPDAWGALVASALPVADFIIDMESESLPAESSLHERQALAKRVLPLLLASEDNLYRQENLQKLARKLRLRETDLLAWAAQQPAPRPRQRSSPQPIEELPPEYWENEYDDAPPELASQPTAAHADAFMPRAIETYCLGLLLKQPDLLAIVNRKLRELADNDEELSSGPLAELCEQDFSGSDCRAVMAILQSGIAQHDQETKDYVLEQAQDDLLTRIHALLGEESVAQTRLRSSPFQTDLRAIASQSRFSEAAGQSQDLILRALQLRRDRLEFERVELQYLQETAATAETAEETDAALQERLNRRMMLSLTARARLDIAIKTRR